MPMRLLDLSWLLSRNGATSLNESRCTIVCVGRKAPIGLHAIFSSGIGLRLSQVATVAKTSALCTAFLCFFALPSTSNLSRNATLIPSTSRRRLCDEASRDSALESGRSSAGTRISGRLFFAHALRFDDSHELVSQLHQLMLNPRIRTPIRGPQKPHDDPFQAFAFRRRQPICRTENPTDCAPCHP